MSRTAESQGIRHGSERRLKLAQRMGRWTYRAERTRRSAPSTTGATSVTFRPRVLVLFSVLLLPALGASCAAFPEMQTPPTDTVPVGVDRVDPGPGALVPAPARRSCAHPSPQAPGVRWQRRRSLPGRRRSGSGPLGCIHRWQLGPGTPRVGRRDPDGPAPHVLPVAPADRVHGPHRDRRSCSRSGPLGLGEASVMGSGRRRCARRRDRRDAPRARCARRTGLVDRAPRARGWRRQELRRRPGWRAGVACHAGTVPDAHGRAGHRQHRLRADPDGVDLQPPFEPRPR